MTLDVSGWTIADHRHAYANGATVAQVVDATLDLLEHLPAAVLIGRPMAERARAHAARLELMDPDSLPLYGVPFLVKDNVDVRGWPTTAACPGFAYIAERDAT